MPELKVTSSHLDRDAFLYIRQSTPRQVLENTESTQRQYALGERAVAQGWSREQIHVIDCDLGKSGSQAAGRDGFQQLVNQVALGKAETNDPNANSPDAGGVIRKGVGDAGADTCQGIRHVRCRFCKNLPQARYSYSSTWILAQKGDR
jgi:resolvase-like protein